MRRDAKVGSLVETTNRGVVRSPTPSICGRELPLRDKAGLMPAKVKRGRGNAPPPENKNESWSFGYRGETAPAAAVAADHCLARDGGRSPCNRRRPEARYAAAKGGAHGIRGQ